MSIWYDLGINTGINVLAVGVGAAGATLLAVARRRRKYRFHRRFWAFLQEPTVFVVGDLDSKVLLNTLHGALQTLGVPEEQGKDLAEGIVDHVQTQELSGLIGRGDFEAVLNMVKTFAELRLDVPRIFSPLQVGEHRQENLILVGGPDVNSFAESLTRRMGCRLEAGFDADQRNLVRDRHLGTTHMASSLPNAQGEMTVTDFGMVARGPHPDNPDQVVLILAGAHGLGTLAATEVCLRQRFEEDLEFARKKSEAFEALVRYERTDGGPENGTPRITLELIRPIGSRSEKS